MVHLRKRHVSFIHVFSHGFEFVFFGITVEVERFKRFYEVEGTDAVKKDDLYFTAVQYVSRHASSAKRSKNVSNVCA